MAKFIFRLQTVYELKLKMEENQKNELAKAIRIMEEAKYRLNEIINERESTIIEYNLQVSKKLTASRHREFGRYIIRLHDYIEIQKECVKREQHNVDKNREALLTVVKERKMLEKFKERKYKEYLSGEMKEEQKRMEEVSSYRYLKEVQDRENNQIDY